MIRADHALHEGKQLRRKARPALPQEKVVSILQANAGELAHDVELIELLLKVQQFHLPGLILSFKRILQGLGGTAVPAAGVEKDNRYFSIHLWLAQLRAMSLERSANLACSTLAAHRSPLTLMILKEV